LPKRGINTHENEIMRAYKTVNETYIEPISFVVPRRAEVFQNDIYPPTTGLRPSVSSDEYFSGKTGLPPKISLESLYDGQEPEEIPASRAPSAAQVKDTPAPAVVSSEKKDPLVQSASVAKPEPSEARAPPPATFTDSKTSMANMASKYADKDGEEDGDDTGSFEEIPKPVERPHAALVERQEEKTGTKTPSQVDSKPSISAVASPTSPSPGQASGENLDASAKVTSRPADQLAQKAGIDKEPDTAAAASPMSPAGGAKGAAEGIKGVLQDMKAMIAAQGKQMAEQSEKIEILAREVASMKARLGE